MSDAEGTCEYVLDPNDPETWGGKADENCLIDDEILDEDGVWACPHDAEADKDRCIFHLPIEEKADDEGVDAFLDAVDETSPSDDTETRQLEFVGAKFGMFDLREESTLTVEDGRVALDYATVTGVLDWSETVLAVQKITLNGIKCDDETRFHRTQFGGETTFERGEFGKMADFRWAEFGGEADFKEAEFNGEADFRGAAFGERVYFREAEFGGWANFPSAGFGGRASFWKAEFEGEASFVSAEFRGKAKFWEAEFGEKADFRGAEFRKKSDFREAAFTGDRLVFSDVEFEEGPIFEDLTLDAVQFDGGDLTDSTFTGASLRNANFESTLLSRATLFDADLRGAKLNGAVLGDVRINEGTQFLGHPSDDSGISPHTVVAIRSRPTCIYDPAYGEDNEDQDVDKAKSVYRSLEELGGKHARPRLQARSFVRRQDLQKNEYKQAAKERNSWEERLIAGARWSRAKVARGTLLYGESPWRVIAWSLGIIFSFALLYPLGGWMKPTDGNPITYAQIAANPAEILNAIYYSTLTYTALGFVDFQPVGFGRLLTTLETALGAVMLALLVFILGRRAAR
ncbi:pentapeptide repeat-containing protein [Halobellus ordinarius]|uniref:pentapeptide repeat-containing protein n=1 Tax=Halobellus ordinarius TaxID=3075120 RepID=UPI0028802F90|nr:pentapeptide repeat-containing protein [Halobellus sp. ZY16]